VLNGSNCALALAHCLGDLRSGETRQPQMDDLLLICAQTAERDPKLPAAIGGDHTLVERGIGRGQFDLVDRQVPSRPELVDDRVVGDGEQPGTEAGAARDRSDG
jgi:hypothetical protein